MAIEISVKYFSRFREELGLAEEAVQTKAGETIYTLIEELRARGKVWASVFSESGTYVTALNHEVINEPEQNSIILKAGDELAFYPPVTGG